MKTTLFSLLSLLLIYACSHDSKTNLRLRAQPEDTVEERKWSKEEMTMAYNIVVTEYLKAGYKTDSIPDTLYIGRYDKSPDIAWPSTILGAHIKLIDFDKTQTVQNRKGYVYLNIMSWFYKSDADFLIVTFKEGGKPKDNCMISLKYNEKGKLELSNLRFENPYTKKTIKK